MPGRGFMHDAITVNIRSPMQLERKLYEQNKRDLHLCL